jgi:hypothetical protein
MCITKVDRMLQLVHRFIGGGWVATTGLVSEGLILARNNQLTFLETISISYYTIHCYLELL